GSALFLRFVTNSSGTASGWNAHYSSTVSEAYCSNTGQPFTTSTGSFSDGSGDQPYQPNTNCTWYIAPPGATSVTLQFNSFQTEANIDVVKVFESLDTNAPPIAVLSGSSLPAPVISNTGTMIIQ